MAVLRGVVGQICWSYYAAARLEGYRVRRDKKTGAWSLAGRVAHADAFTLSQKPLVFVAPRMGNGPPRERRWPNQELDIQDGEVAAAVGPHGQKERDGGQHRD